MGKLEKQLKVIKARDIMTTSVVTIKAEMPLYDVANLMLEKKISGVPVTTTNGDIEGVATITDLFLAMGIIKYSAPIENEKVPSKEPIVRSIMTKEVITITEDETLGSIIDIMIHRGVHTLPVVRDGKMIGVIGRRDVVRQFYLSLEDIFKNKL